MPLPQRLFAGDEERGKKDDEYKAGRSRAWQHRRMLHAPPRRSLKKIVLGILAVIALYCFIKNIPTDLKPVNQRPRFEPQFRDEGPRRTKPPGSSKPPGGKSVHTEVERDFDGPIKFFDLATTLHSVGRMMGASPFSQNVLFAAASLKSAAILLPIACEMALQERNDVHFAFLGRDDIPMDLLKSVNGITNDCKMMFHDARPDFAPRSTDFRMEVSCSAAFKHIDRFIHPQATLIDGSGEEELYFMRGLGARVNDLGKTLIELPENTEQRLMWITLLDSNSLAAWNKVTVDLVVHAQPSASGSLLRLLQSLKKADFFSSTPPRLTIELPHKTDAATTQYLKDFKWPPTDTGSGHGNLLTIHHRIPQYGLTAEENSIRVLESFWPADPENSHVVILSPQAEVSPLFFHYLKYSMLEYKYSTTAFTSQNLLGISLDLPSTYLNDTTTFSPPSNGTDTPFLWQAPNSNAALYFGDKWMELHALISNILISQHKLPTPTTLHAKEVSKTYPSWLEHILKLARARGYTTIYPNFESGDSLVTLHNDLYKPPEEFKNDAKKDTAKDGELRADVQEHLSLKHKEAPLIHSGLLSLIGNHGKLPALADMPVLRYDGEEVDTIEMLRGAMEYAKVFRSEIGGCSEEEIVAETSNGGVEDLFCLEDKTEKKPQ